jgi:hypothetical protein
MIKVVNMIPASLSGETNQDSEPSLAVNPANPKTMVGTAFTPAPTGGTMSPIYVSTDGGNTWSFRNVLPGGSGGTHDISVGFGLTSGRLYAGILNASNNHFQILRTANAAGVTPMTQLTDRANEDQPWVVATSVKLKSLSRDRVYVGNNNFNTVPKTATVDLSLNAATAAAPAGFAPHKIENGAANPQDGPPIRIAVHADGHVYAAFQRWTSGSSSVGNFNMDVVITRDDNGGSGANPFQALGAAGKTIAAGRFIRFNATMGQERLGADLAIAVDPNNSGTVWIAWCDRVGGVNGTDWTMHVRRSTDHGVTWSGDLRTITNAKNPALAVNSNGELGLLYQAFTGSRWITRLELTFNGWSTAATTVVLHTAPSSSPARLFFPYIGDYVRMLAIGTSFYGVFCGNNTPDSANFPNGVTYQRGANWATKTLLSTDGVTHVPVSIDPFFFEWSPPPLPIITPAPHPIATIKPITRDPITTKPQPISIVDPPPLIGPVPSPVTRGKTTRRGKGSTIDL